MPFNIHQRLFDEDGEYDEEAALRYRDELMARFASSPEGQEVAERYRHVGWVDTFMDYAFGYLGVSLPEMSSGDVDEIVLDIIPRKVSAQPGSGHPIIQELRAFWSFLRREFQLANADECFRALNAITGEELERELQDPANFGMAKSFVMLGREAGFDMTTEEGLQAFAAVYNASLAAGPPPLLALGETWPESRDPHSGRATKKVALRRKMAKASRRKNRKK